MNKYFVSRQKYWGVEEENAYICEIAQGGLDYANPDMLVPKWSILGEGKEFTDPKEAAVAAIAVCEAWRASGEINAKVAFGHTGGNTLPFDPTNYDDLLAKTDDIREKLPKCDECGELLGKETFTHDLVHGDEKFCREYCADLNYQHLMSEEYDDDETEDDA